jgi:hypothetical protein
MPVQPTTRTESRGVLAILALFILAVALWDYAAISWLSDTFLPPSLRDDQMWVKRGDWAAVQCYSDDWRAALLGWAGGHLSDGVLIAAIVLIAHSLFWSGVYYFGRALFGGSRWIALLGVAMVRVCPDLFQVHLLSAQSPARLIAVALAFWSVGLTIRRWWVAACCAAGLIAHFSPTVACWFAQFIVVALFCLNHEWKWRTSLIGAACFLAIAAGPLVRFLVEGVIPDAPIPNEATVGLHFFADPTLSPLSVPLWVYVCLVVYLAMTFVWLKQRFSRRSTPIAIVFFLLGFGGMLLDILFVGVIPVERAARFELQALRAFWFLWTAVFYAPQLADEIAVAWPKGKSWRPIFRGLSFSMPWLWSAITLAERWHQPPRWNRVILVLMLTLLLLTIHPSERSVAEPVWALVIAASILTAAVVAGMAGKTGGSANLVRAMSAAILLFAVSWVFLDGKTAARAFSESRRVMARDADWAAACRWIADNSPADSIWSAPWRPRQFRRWTDRAVLVSRDEAPSDPSRRFEWFLMYAETHEWPGGVGGLSPSLHGERNIEWLREYRCRFLFGLSHHGAPSPDRLVCSSALPQGYGVHYAICDKDLPPRLVQEHGSVSLERLQTVGTYELFKIALTRPRP